MDNEIEFNDSLERSIAGLTKVRKEIEKKWSEERAALIEEIRRLSIIRANQHDEITALRAELKSYKDGGCIPSILSST